MPTTLTQKYGPLIVSMPLAGEMLTVSPVPGHDFALGFNTADATVSRQGDSLVFAMNNGGSVTIADFFPVDARELPVLTQADGTPAALDDLLLNVETAPIPEPDRTVVESGNGASEQSGDLDSLIDGVSRLGVLGTLYWGNDQEAAAKDSEPEESLTISQSTYLRAQDNLGILTCKQSGTEQVEVAQGYYATGDVIKEQTPAPGSDDKWAVSGNLDQYRIPGAGEKQGVAASGNTVEPFTDRGFDIESFVNGNTSLQGWTAGEDSLAGLERQFSISADAVNPRLQVAWSMYQNGGTAAGDGVAIAFLFKLGAGGELIYVGHKALESAGDGTAGAGGGLSASVSWSVEPGGQYVVPIVVAQAGQPSGSGIVLTVDSLEYIHYDTPVWVPPVYDDVPLYTAAVEGNVISDPFAGSGDPNETGQAAGVDHHSEGLDFSVTRFLLNGEWFDATGETVHWSDQNGVRYSFTMDAEGAYSLEASGSGVSSSSIGELNVTYEIASSDGLTDQADLYLRSPEHTFFADAQESGVITGSEGDDVIYAGLDADLIYGGGGSDVMYASDSTDIFIWRAEDLDGSLDTIKGFSLADNDKLRFEGLFDDHDELESLLGTGAVSLERAGDILSLDITADSGATVHVDVNVQSGQLNSFASVYTAEHGSDEGLDLAQLKYILTC